MRVILGIRFLQARYCKIEQVFNVNQKKHINRKIENFLQISIILTLTLYFISAYTTWKYPEEIMTKLADALAEKKLIQFQTERISPSLFTSTIEVMNLLNRFVQSASHFDAKHKVAKEVVDKLQQMSEKIHDSPQRMYDSETVKAIANMLPSPPKSLTLLAPDQQGSVQFVDTEDSDDGTNSP